MKANGTVKKEAAPPPQSLSMQLTEMEQVKLENFVLRHNSLQQQLQNNLAARAAFIAEIEANRPGYRWDEQKGLVLAEGDRL